MCSTNFVWVLLSFFFFKQKTAYEIVSRDWSSDVCSSDLEFVEFSVQADSATQTYRGRVAVTVPENAVILPGKIGRASCRERV